VIDPVQLKELKLFIVDSVQNEVTSAL